MNIELKLEDSMWTAPEIVTLVLPEVRWTQFTKSDWVEGQRLLLAIALAIGFVRSEYRNAGRLAIS